METITIGISGQSGAGKSSLCKDLQNSLSNCNLIHQDWYFKPIAEIAGINNFCELNCLSISKLVSDTLSLIKGNGVKIHTLDLETFEPKGEVDLEPKQFLIIEGMTIFRIPELRPAFNLRVYLDPGLDEIMHRKLVRDLTIRHKSTSEVLFQMAWLRREYQRDLQEFIQNTNVIKGDFSREAIHSRVMTLMQKSHFI